VKSEKIEKWVAMSLQTVHLDSNTGYAASAGNHDIMLSAFRLTWRTGSHGVSGACGETGVRTLSSRAYNRIRSRAMAALLATLLTGAFGVTTTLGQTYYYTQPTASYTGVTTAGTYTTPARTAQPQYTYNYTYPTQAASYTYPAYTYSNAAPAQSTYQSYYSTPTAPTYANYTYAQPAATASAGSSAGFLSWLNGVRAQYGLSPVGYDSSLEGWAASNNAQQASHGLGHYVMGPARRQNSAVGDAGSIGSMWMNSPAHRAALLDPSITRIGLAGNGQYWTFNAN
jgi:uncharacterized protein YkwD